MTVEAPVAKVASPPATRLFLGVDPGLQNIGLFCITETGTIVAQGSFGYEAIKTSNFGDQVGNFIHYLEEVLTKHFFPLLQKHAPCDVYCCVEKQFSSCLPVISGILLTLVATHGIKVQQTHCQDARRALGIPLDHADRLVFKHRVIQYYESVLGQECKNHHIADAFVMAAYARFCICGNTPRCTVQKWFSRPKTTSKKSSSSSSKRKPAAKKRNRATTAATKRRK
jgi:Holliday junction resolvasome RuvABC endonuclease subunit